MKSNWHCNIVVITQQGESCILRHSNDQIFLNHPLIYRRGLDRDAMAKCVAQRARWNPD